MALFALASLDSKELLHYAVEYGVPAGKALAFLFGTYLAARVAAWLVQSSLRKAKIEETLVLFFSKMVRWFVLLAGVLGILGMFGVQTTSFAAVIGATGLAVGLAFQGTLGNFASGVMLLVFRPYKVGDVVNVAGQTGSVTEIDLFSTILCTPDNRHIVIPNGSIFGSTIENMTFHPQRRVDVTVGVDYEADIEKTRDVLLKTAETVEGALEDPAFAVVLVNLGASSVDWAVRIWCRTEDYWAVKERATIAVKRALDEAGIGIPYPHLDIQLNQPGAKGE